MNVLRVTPRFSHLWSSNEVSPSLLRFTMSLGHWITLLGFWRFHRIQMSTLQKRRGFNQGTIRSHRSRDHRRREVVEPCTDGKVGAQRLVSFGSCCCSFFERALPQNVGGAKRTWGTHTRVFGSSTPLCVAEEKTACHYNLSSLRIYIYH